MNRINLRLIAAPMFLSGLVLLSSACGGTGTDGASKLRASYHDVLGKSTAALDDCSVVHVCNHRENGFRFPAVEFGQGVTAFMHVEYYDGLGCTGNQTIEEGHLNSIIYIDIPETDMSAQWTMDSCDQTACTDYLDASPEDCFEDQI